MSNYFIILKKKLLEEYPDKYVSLDQFSDPANILAHYHTTAKEIIEQMDGKVDMIVVGIGTAGTGVGVSMRIKEYNKNIKIIGVMPKLGVKIQGMRNILEENPTKLFKQNAFDEIIEIDQSEVKETYKLARDIAKREGVLIGMSSASIMYVAVKKSYELTKDKNILAILPDNGMKYLSTELFDE
ncbi:MAG: pyridoxal-phosphate dependent enzyme [Candidatus Anstonellales archaeon]